MDRYDSYDDQSMCCGPDSPTDSCHNTCRKCHKPKKSCLCQCKNQGGLSATQGDLTETQGDQAQNQGDLSAAQGDLTETQGDQAQNQGDLSAAQGDLTETQGDQAQNQGDLSAAQGDLTETQGDQAQNQGDLSAAQGDLSEILGDQTQSITGHEGQNQGEQNQGDQTHGDQTQGDQTLSSSPTISTPVNVSGVNVNVTVSCCDELNKQKKQNDCQIECRKTITTLLSFISTLSKSIPDPESSQMTVYYAGVQEPQLFGNLNHISDCTFGMIPESEENERIFLLDSLEALSIEPTSDIPNLFSLLLPYLQSSANFPCISNSEDTCQSNDDCCSKKLARQLQVFYTTKTNLKFFLTAISFTGFIYQIINGIIYLVDDLIDPTFIYAIPVCKILSYQPLNTPLFVKTS